MKQTSIKIYVVKQLVMGSILAFILTIFTFIVCFGSLHIISKAAYDCFLNTCNQSPGLMGGILLLTIVIFLVYFLLIFMKRMNTLTDYIGEITEYVGRIAEGNLEIQVPVRQHNELAILADGINEMAGDLKIFIEKEHEWDRQKYNLITNLSHDLKTPLMSVMGYLELICSKKYDDEDTLAHYSQVAFDKSRQLKELIQQLFELSKLNDPDMKLHKEKVNMEELVSQVFLGFMPELEKRKLSYGVECASVHKIANVDAQLMVRVFENLIGNALKYAKGAHYIMVTIEESMSEEIVFHVYNDGEPITGRNQEKIFMRFYQTKKGESEKEGSGIGLAVVQTIVALHKGTICVKSNSEKTDFIVKLPMTDKSEG